MSESTAPPSAASAAASRDRFPPQIKYIVGNEACERFSYYGLMGIMEMYLVNRLQMSSNHATQVLHLFGMAVYFLPLLGGWLADWWVGRYWTIFSLSLVYCLGQVTLAAGEGTRLGLFAGLALIAIGAGGIKSSVAAFVGDQFGADQEHLMTKVYGWFYWAVNVGAAGAFFIVPWLHSEKLGLGYRLAFAVPGIFMGLATLVFWMGRRYYVHKPPARQEKRVRPAGEKQEDLKAVLGILMIFAPIPMFWALFNQVNSTWVLQGNSMKAFHLLTGETMQGSGALLVMIWVPVLTLGIYPLARRLGLNPTPLRRMSAGMLLAAASFIISGMVQDQLDAGRPLSVLWQLAPYTVLEAGEVLLSASALEFAFEQAPLHLKSVIMALWYLANAAGQLLIVIITGLNHRYFKAQGGSVFYFYSIMMIVCAGLFVVCVSLFRDRRAGRARS
ncbi:MAG: MFS transporter [Verrucomicrobiota bacterium]|jgi:POT family proton-dependent oligopeptide transporter